MEKIFIVTLLILAINCYKPQRGFELLETKLSKFQKSSASRNYSTEARNLIYQVEDDLWKELDDARKTYQNHSIFCSQTYDSLNCENYDSWTVEIANLNRSLISYQKNLTILNQTLLNFTNQSSAIIDELVANRTRKLARIAIIEDELDSLKFLLSLICNELFNSSNCTFLPNNNNTNNNTSNTSNNVNNNTNNNSNDDRTNLSNALPGDTSTEKIEEESSNEVDSSEGSDGVPSNDEKTKKFIELNKNIKNIQSFLFEKKSSFDIQTIIQNNNELKEEYFSSDLVSIIEGFISNHTFDQLMIWKIKILLLRLKHSLLREKRKILRSILRLNQTITNTDYEFDLKIEKVNNDISDTTDQIKALKARISDLKTKNANCDEGIARRKECDDETKNMTVSIQKLEEEMKIVEKVVKLINYL